MDVHGTLRDGTFPAYLDADSLSTQTLALGDSGFLVLRDVFKPAYFAYLQRKLVKPYQRFFVNVETPLYDDPGFQHFVSRLVGCRVTRCLPGDPQTAWVRLYTTRLRHNPFSHFHIDLNRYRGRQFRIVVNLFDDSDCDFEYKRVDGRVVSVPTEANSLCVIEAGRLRHRVDLRSGRRLLLMMDFTTTQARGAVGCLGLAWDYAWMKCVASRIRTRVGEDLSASGRMETDGPSRPIVRSDHSCAG